MEKEKELPALFAGATHRIMPAGEPVKVTRWVKDGDHAKVVRYPIERREYKGLLVIGPKKNFALRFGEYIVEDAKGRLYVIAEQALPAEYVSLEAPKASPAAIVAIALFALVCALAARGLETDTPLLVGFGVTHLMYYSALLGQWNGLANAVFDLDTDTMKASAHTNTYSPNQDTHDFFDDATNEVTGTNYSAGGATLASPVVSRSGGTVTFDANDVVWTQHASGFSNARKFVVYRSTGTGSTSRLFSVVTADADVGNVTGDLTLAWHTSGLATWSTT